MRPLRSCDFCGADAVGAFEVLPAELEPTEREQRRVVLCDGCKRRLEDLLEPVLARLTDDADAPADAVAGRESGRPGTDESRAVGEGTAAGSESLDADANGVALAGSTRSADEEDGDGIEGAADRRAVSPETSASGITVEPDVEAGTDGSSADESATEPIGDSSGSAADEPDVTESDADESDADEPDADDPGTVESDADGADAAETDQSAEADDAPARPPEVYANVVRLLRNRQFPMERSAVESLAASAYDLERHEVDAVIDHAIERGELVERDGTLDRP